MADQSVTVSYAQPGQGGMPYLFVTTTDATSLGLCGLGGLGSVTADGSTNSVTNNAAASTGSAALSMIAPHPAVVGAGVLVLVAAASFGRFFA
jgi:hypothetical protein